MWTSDERFERIPAPVISEYTSDKTSKITQTRVVVLHSSSSVIEYEMSSDGAMEIAQIFTLAPLVYVFTPPAPTYNCNTAAWGFPLWCNLLLLFLDFDVISDQ